MGCRCCLAPLLSEGAGSSTEPTLGTGGRWRRSAGKGLVPFVCPDWEPLAWLLAKNLLTRQGPNPVGGQGPRPA